MVGECRLGNAVTAGQVLAAPSGSDPRDDWEVERVPARSGAVTARVRRPGSPWKWLHSQYDPVGEARALVERAGIGERGTVIVLGLALGHHIDEVFRRVARDAAVVVFDPYAGRLDPAGLLLRRYAKEGRHFACLDNLDHFRNLLHTSLWVMGRGGVSVLEHPPSVDMAPDLYADARKAIRDAAIHGRLATHTQQVLRGIWLVNIAANISALVRDPGVEPLRDMCAGRTAIVVAAGPSLDKNARFLHHAKGRAVIIAAGSGYAALRRNGIEPDIVSVIDPTPANQLDFQLEIPRTTALVYETKTTPGVVRAFRGPRFAWTSGDRISAWLEKRIGPRAANFAAGTVAYSGLMLARHLGARRIVFAGLDLALTGGKSHAAGVATTKPVHLDDPEIIWLPGYHGEDVPTNRLFYSFQRMMEMAFAEASAQGVDIVDATEGGVAKQYARRVPLSEVVAACEDEPMHLQERLAAAAAAESPPAAVGQRVRRDLERLCRRMATLDELLVRAIRHIDELNRLVYAFDLPNSDGARARLADRIKETSRRVFEENEKVNAYGDVVDLLGMGLYYLLHVDHGNPEELSIERKIELNSLFYAELRGAVRTILPQLQGAVRELAAQPDEIVG